ncbi:MAG: DNA topoisomerase IB, partial [Acetobacteraceae bacterium]
MLHVALALPTDVQLVHVSDRDPGILRRQRGRGFSYVTPEGGRPGPDELERIRRLGIPPAYRDVWICVLPNGHLQATGIDARGRKQYRYHPDWALARSETKFSQLITFGTSLAALRRAVQRDLRQEAGDLAFTRAALVLLMDKTLIRIGDPVYTAENKSFGATTLLSRHLRVENGGIRLNFVAKGGKKVQMSLRDRRLERIFNEIGDLPGKHLFTYIDSDGAVRRLMSQDVNAWLAEQTGASVTAKTFRTWGGTLAAFETALSCALSEAPANKLTLRAMAEAASQRLHNTPTIAKKSYIHPAVLDLAAIPADELAERLSKVEPPPDCGLRGTEA